MFRILCIFSWLTLAITACGTRSSAARPITVTAEHDGIAYSLEVARNTYVTGESAKIKYRVTNNTESVADVGSVPNCEYCMYQIRAVQGTEEVWKTCRVRPPCGHKEFTLLAHETHEWLVDWNLTNDNGTLEPEDDVALPVGRYTLIANLGVANQPRLFLSMDIEVR
jgi:hypothetical protein